jgi:hypothetical protein
MGKILSISILLLAVGCGQTECQKYATVYCGRAAQCGYVMDGVTVRPATDECEKAAVKAFAAANITEEQCTAANAKVLAMSCADFQKLAAGAR